MSWKVFAGLALLWLIALGLDATLWGGYFITKAGDSTTDINVLFSPPIATATDVWGMVSGLIAIPSYVLAWFKLLLWDFTFFDGNFQIFRYVMITISVAITFGLVQTWIRGVRA